MPAKKSASKKSPAKKTISKRSIPVAKAVVMKKSSLLAQLGLIDSDQESRERVLNLESAFRKKIDAHTIGLPAEDAVFDKFNTNPFVLLIHASSRDYSSVDQIERDILPAKQFSSMETSAGRMVEEVVLPVYGWQCVLSKMHSSNSALDGRKLGAQSYEVATLKSGPRCLNDEMSENFADAILEYAPIWSKESETNRVQFTYGVLYGTPRKSNKKDWHILRKLAEKCAVKKKCHIVTSPLGRWDCKVEINGTPVEAHVRVGNDWWKHLGGDNCLCEILVAMIRACVAPAKRNEDLASLTIRDLPSIISTSEIPETFNVALLQKSQIPWLFLMARHFCDDLI